MPVAPMAKLISATIPWFGHITHALMMPSYLRQVVQKMENCFKTALSGRFGEVLTVGPANRDVPESAIAAHPPLQNPT